MKTEKDTASFKSDQQFDSLKNGDSGLLNLIQVQIGWQEDEDKLFPGSQYTE